MEPHATTALSRLGRTPSLERAYLDFLIGENGWEQARIVAEGILERHDPRDSEQLLDVTDRLLAAGRGEEALVLCRRIHVCPAPVFPAGPVSKRSLTNGLTNGQLAMAPVGRGFDWRIPAPRSVSIQWETGRLLFTPSGAEPDAYALLEQWIVVAPRHYRLGFEYQTPAEGLRWVLEDKAPAGQSSPVLAAAVGWRRAEWSFQAGKEGVARLRFLYRRVEGSTRLRGRVAVRNLNLEPL